MQTSAAAFTKGLLDLEGSALTPILVRCARGSRSRQGPRRRWAPPPRLLDRLPQHATQRSAAQRTRASSHTCLGPRSPAWFCSLVKKDAGMLDAFGKGASADIQLSKQELYAQVWVGGWGGSGVFVQVCGWLGRRVGGHLQFYSSFRRRVPAGIANWPGPVNTHSLPPLIEHHITLARPFSLPPSHTPPQQMTWDPETNTSMATERVGVVTEPQLATPLVSPPLSPKVDAPLPPGMRPLRSAGNSGTPAGVGWRLGRGCAVPLLTARLCRLRRERAGWFGALALGSSPPHPALASLPPLMPLAEDGNGASLRMAGRMGSYNSISSAEAFAAARATSSSPVDVCSPGEGVCVGGVGCGCGCVCVCGGGGGGGGSGHVVVAAAAKIATGTVVACARRQWISICAFHAQNI